MRANAKGEAHSGPLQLTFDRSVISSDGGLLLRRELDDALGRVDLALNHLADPRAGRNGRHRLAGLLRQSIFSRLAGYEDVNDADRLRRDPVMRQLVGGRAMKHGAASASAMGRFEAQMLTRHGNMAVLADLPGRWIDAMFPCRVPNGVTLDMDSSESPAGQVSTPARPLSRSAGARSRLIRLDPHGNLLASEPEGKISAC